MTWFRRASQRNLDSHQWCDIDRRDGRLGGGCRDNKSELGSKSKRSFLGGNDKHRTKNEEKIENAEKEILKYRRK